MNISPDVVLCHSVPTPLEGLVPITGSPESLVALATGPTAPLCLFGFSAIFPLICYPAEFDNPPSPYALTYPISPQLVLSLAEFIVI